jgi:hypothetical protein
MVHKPHTDVRAHKPSLPVSLAAILGRSLAKTPEARFSSVERLKDALDALRRAIEPATIGVSSNAAREFAP